MIRTGAALYRLLPSLITKSQRHLYHQTKDKPLTLCRNVKACDSKLPKSSMFKSHSGRLAASSSSGPFSPAFLSRSMQTLSSAKNIFNNKIQNSTMFCMQEVDKTLLSHNHRFGGAFLTSQREFRREPGIPIDDPADRVLSQLQEQEDSTTEHAGWLIRLANENGYLSWCRNVYVATIAGATMYGQTLHVVYSNEAGVLLFLMGALNLLSGTASFIYTILHLRQRMHMSRAVAGYYIMMSLLHMMLWFGGVALYLGYVEEEEEETKNINDSFKRV